MRSTWPLLLLLVLALAAPACPGLAPPWPEDVAGARRLPPLTRAWAVRLAEGRTRIVTRLVAGEDGVAAVRDGRPVLFEHDEVRRLTPRRYWLGTDALGRDVTGLVLRGIRHSLVVAAAAVALCVVLGVAAGALAALGGTIADRVVMRVVDGLLALPMVLVFLVFAAFFRPSTAALVLALGGLSWPALARLVRADLAALRGREFALAARAAGGSRGRLLLGHLLPQLAPLLAVSTALRFADTVVLESALAFLGFGAPPPAVSLGDVIAAGRNDLAQAWWVTAAPTGALVVIVVVARSRVAGLFRSSEPPSLI